MRAEWRLPELIGYIGTWSATTRYRSATGEDPLIPLAAVLRAEWGPEDRAHAIRWPLTIRAGRLQTGS